MMIDHHSQKQLEEVQCPHIRKLLHIAKNQSKGNRLQYFSFIKPQLRGWLCLNDGCFRKVCSLQVIQQQAAKFEPFHKIFIEMSRFQIFCFECNLQITDNMEYFLPHINRKDIKQIRRLAVEQDKQQQKTLFGSNIQYPSGFHKQKVGLSGTVGTQINSYVNAVIQLLAHTPPFYKISEDTNLQSIKDQYFKETLICINKIRSGAYRIVQTKKVEQKLLQKNKQFLQYSNKTAIKFLFQILKTFLQQFCYFGPKCKPSIIHQPTSLQTLNPEPLPKAKYSPMKQLFGGQFKWMAKCQQCSQQKQFKIEFQCLRISNQNINGQNVSSKLEQLIENSFNLKKTFSTVFQDLHCNRPACMQNEAQYRVLEQKSKIKLPNILVLQFDAEQGINVQYSDVLDLTKYAMSQNQEYKYHYVCSIAKNSNKKYFTHVRQFRELSECYKQYIFDDVIIKQDASRPNKIVNAIYKLQPFTKNKNISKNIQSSFIVNVDCFVPLPDFWNHYISELRNVQPLINHFVCRHGYLCPQVKSKTINMSKVPPSIYQYLVEQFGGQNIKIQKQLDYCKTCIQKLRLIRQLKQSERQMAMFADQLSSKKLKVFIDIKWFNEWKKYLYENSKNNYDNEGCKRPGPINNKRGVKQNGQVQQSLYKKISPQVWYFFKRFYGGGPLIAKSPTQPSLALTQAVDLRFEKIKGIIQAITSK